jgi:hypothetical protein
MKVDPQSYDYSNAQRGSSLAPVLPHSMLRQSSAGFDENEGPSVPVEIGIVPVNPPMTMDCSVQKIEAAEVDQGVCQRITECMSLCFCLPKKDHVE